MRMEPKIPKTQQATTPTMNTISRVSVYSFVLDMSSREDKKNQSSSKFNQNSKMGEFLLNLLIIMLVFVLITIFLRNELNLANKRSYDEMSAGSSHQHSFQKEYEQMKVDTPLLVAEIRVLRSEKSILFDESIARKLKNDQLKEELQRQKKVSELLKKDLKESKLTIAELKGKPNNLQATADLPGTAEIIGSQVAQTISIGKF